MLVASRRDDASRGRTPAPPRRAYWVAPAIAVCMLILTLVWGAQYGMGIRDPDGIIGWRFTFVVALVGGFWALDVIPRGIMAARTQQGADVGDAGRDRARALAVGPVRLRDRLDRRVLRDVPLLPQHQELPAARPPAPARRRAGRLRALAVRPDPATLLHQLLGTGVSAQVLSTVYLLFLTFVPISVGVTLVWSTNRAGALWWVSVLSINWVIGALSYFVLPSMGPAFTEPQLFSGAAGHRDVDAPAHACSRSAGRSWATRRERGAAEHRGVRVAAHLDRVRRRADGAPAARPARDADRHVGLPRR